MSLNPKLFLILCFLLSFPDFNIDGKGSNKKENLWRPKAAFSLQTDLHYSFKNDLGASRFRANSYLTGIVRNKYMEAGLRLEELSHPLPGHEEEKGWGPANFYIKGGNDYFELVAGDFYEQFGSGLLLRSYEDRNLGIDNSIRGGKLTLRPYKGIRAVLLGGQHRFHFDRKYYIWQPERGAFYGSDVHLDIAQWSESLRQKGWSLNAGASAVLKKERTELITKITDEGLKKLVFSEYVGGASVRVHVQNAKWDIYSECAFKTSDPDAGNGYSFGIGNVSMLTLSYADKGFSVLAGARRSDGFDFRHVRSSVGPYAKINHLLPFNRQQTYSLASLYPYSTQADGEWAFQAEISYRFPKKSFLGGKYGTEVNFAASHIRGLDKEYKAVYEVSDYGRNGGAKSFFGTGALYYNDLNIEVSKKFSKKYSLSFLYINQAYNQFVVEGHSEGDGMIYSNIFVYEGKHRFSKKLALRTELQYLHTRQAEKDWIFRLLEFSVAPRFIFTLSNQWNIGLTRRNYYMFSVAYAFSKSRLQLSFGQTRRGINCSGGVCRMMPETKGFYLSFNTDF